MSVASCGRSSSPPAAAGGEIAARWGCDPAALAGECALLCWDGCRGDAPSDEIPAPVGATWYVRETAGTSPVTVDAMVLPATDCNLSADGFVWYAIPEPHFPPTRALVARCGAPNALVALSDPAVPHWAQAPPRTAAVFVGGSLQDDLSRLGTVVAAAIAHEQGIPLTWMLGNLRQLSTNADIYDRTHRIDGDDLQIEPYDDLKTVTARRLPWFQLRVTIDGGGHERLIAHDLAMGSRAFWGITWNSSGVDGILDRGAPWGAYCADPKSYKRPDPSGDCPFVGLEWTARDLTRSYFSGHEETYSTEPVDLTARALLEPAAAARYVRQLVDAYAAAGETRPLVVMTQQEVAITGADPMAAYTVLSALYGEVRRVGMRALTMGDAVEAARAFAGQPRAVAFPFIAGLPNIYEGFPNPSPRPYPATVDYVDRDAAMTFVSGQAMPTRVFPYAADTQSVWYRQLLALPPALIPTIQLAARADHALYLQLFAPAPTHSALALWSDRARLGWRSPESIAAGHAAVIVPLNLPAGASQITLRCDRCGDQSLPLSP